MFLKIMTRAATVALIALFLFLGLVATGGIASAATKSASAANSAMLPARGEVLTVPFRKGADGVYTKNVYHGWVQVTGAGRGAGSQWTDAFYKYTDQFGNSVNPAPVEGLYNFTLWINHQHADQFVNPTPRYNSGHAYRFTIFVPRGKINFGVGDIFTSDNQGSYTVTVSQM